MRLIKYVIGAIFLTLVLVFIGDMYVWNMESFETEYISTTMYLPVSVTQQEMIEEVTRAAEANQCCIFTVVKDLKSNLLSQITVYGMEGAEETLREKNDLSEGVFHSVLVGDIEFVFDKMENIPDISKIEKYYIIGTIEDARTLKSQLVDKYSGNFPKPGYVYLHVTRNILLIWIIGLLFFALLSMFEVSMIKKELVLRVIHGESFGGMIAKAILMDIVFFVGYYLGGMVVLYQTFGLHTEFHDRISFACLAIFCVIDSFIFLSLLFTDYKRSLNDTKANGALLRLNYFFKTTIFVVIVIVMSVFISMVVQAVNYYKQKDFFKRMATYSYYSVAANDNTLESTERAMEAIYHTYDERGMSFLDAYLDNGMFTKSPCLLCNRGALDYLRECIPEIDEQELEEKIYFIVPKTKQQAAIQDLEFFMQMYVTQNQEYEIITYTGNVSMIGLHKEKTVNSQFYKNPLVILNCMDYCDYYNGMYLIQNAMVQCNDDDWASFIEEYELSDTISNKTNVYENYQYLWSGYYRMALMGSIVLGILMILSAVVLKTVVQFECSIHSMEIAVKTTLGYGILGKYQVVILPDLLAILSSGILCAVLSNTLLSGSWLYVLIGAVSLAGINFMITVFTIKSHESRHIQRALKGAIL